MKKLYILIVSVFILCKLINAQDYTLKTNTGHTDVITSISISTDNKYIISGSEDKSVILWDIKSGKELATFVSPNNLVKSVAFSPNTKQFACAEGDIKAKNKIYIWDIKEHKIVKTIEDNKGIITNLQYSSDGRYLLSGGPSELILRDVDAGIKIRDFVLPKEPLQNIDFSADGKNIVASSENIIYIWNINSCEIAKTLKGHTDKITNVKYSKDNKYIVSGSNDKSIRIWDADSGKEISNIDDHGYKLENIAISGDNKWIASSDMNESIKLWDLETGVLTNTLDGHKGRIGGLFFNNDNSMLVSYGRWDRTIKLWDTKSGEIIKALQGLPKYIFDKAYFDKGNNFAVGKDYNIVIFSNLTQGKSVKLFAEENGLVSCVDNYKNNKIVYGTTTNEIRIIDLKNKNKKTTCRGHSAWIKNIKFSPDGSNFAATSHNTIKIWDANTGAELLSFEKSPEVVFSLCYSHNGKYLAVGENKKISIWEVSTGNNVKTIKGIKTPVFSLAFSNDDKQIVSGEGNDEFEGTYKASLWNVETGKKIKDITESNKKISSIKFSFDNKYILLSTDKIIKKIEIENGKELLNFQAHERWIVNVEFSNDNKRIISTSEDGTIKVWDNTTGKLELTQIAIKGTFDRITFTPDGKFNGTEDGIKNFYFVKDLKIINLENLYEKFYTPNLSVMIEEGFDFKNHNFDIKGLEPVADLHINEPSNEMPMFRGPLETRLTTNNKIAKVKVTATDKGGGIDEIRLYQNKKLVQSKKLEVDSTGKQVVESFNVNLSKGINEIEIATYNKERTKKSEVFGIEYTGDEFDPANLYILSIGINEYKKPAYNLNYAVSDATSFTKELKNGSKKLFDKVNLISLTNAQANKANIVAAFDSIKSVIKPSDVFIFYYAGHGSMAKAANSENDIFYLVPWEVTNLYNFEMLQQKGISAKMLKEFSKNISAEKQMFVLDACQSGGAVEYLASRGSEKEMAISQLAHSTGTYFISASGSKQLAGEFETLGHGVFTYVILEALKGKAATNGKITVKGLTYYVEDQVPALSKKYKGAAQYPVSFGFGQDFPIILIDK